ncbi:MAG: DUF1499 domain-containing protein [Alphaproteobacteria bacterium]|nr:DUF1499 domain-containing protein [Alphaproteobacteria bacterium]
MRIPIRTSRWAIWARRIASLALPLEVIPVLMHRERMIGSDAFTLLFAIGLALAALAVAVSIIALMRLWQSGFRGWSRTLQALLLGLFLVAPAGIAISWAVTYPPTNDVATLGPLPELAIARNPLAHRLAEAETLRAFPNAVARTYPMAPGDVFDLAVGLVTERQWEARIRRRPVAPAYQGRIHALAMTLLGFRDEVAILIDWTESGTIVSMRSASLFGVDDLGTNGKRIEAFLIDLDAAVTEAQRRAPIIEGLTPGSANPPAEDATDGAADGG